MPVNQRGARLQQCPDPRERHPDLPLSLLETAGLLAIFDHGRQFNFDPCRTRWIYALIYCVVTTNLRNKPAGKAGVNWWKNCAVADVETQELDEMESVPQHVYGDHHLWGRDRFAGSEARWRSKNCESIPK